MKQRVLIVDDHQVVREGFCSLLENDPNVEVVGQAGDGRTAVQLVQKLMPSLVLMDISMPDMNGVDAAQLIRREFPEVKIIILSIHTDRRFVERALHAGVNGYLLKNCAFDELINAIKTVGENQVYLSPGIAGVVVDGFLRHFMESRGRGASFDSLTLREREVLQLIAEGMTTKMIAERLNIGVKTAETHRQRIMDKLDQHSIADLVKYAIREGLTSLE